ncbi:MAG: low-complexity tail membrane protein [Cyanobacteria bacterium M_surface_7_m2_040]|nr:low-complexity tail membrane protein [Cyanobacteria bacterium M_surface_7_m2_040]
MTPRSAPYLWVQLINGGALPLEALLLLLLLAGADPGPVPALERLLAWALGAAAPALLLWQRPANPRSLLLLSGKSSDCSDLEQAMIVEGSRMRAPRLIFALGVVVVLPLLGWLDATAALASQLSPLHNADRLVCLMAASGVLALMVWQWQQLIQATWLLIPNQGPAADSATPAPQSAGASTTTRSLGLPLLRWPHLEWPVRAEQASPWLHQAHDEALSPPERDAAEASQSELIEAEVAAEAGELESREPVADELEVDEVVADEPEPGELDAEQGDLAGEPGELEAEPEERAAEAVAHAAEVLAGEALAGEVLEAEVLEAEVIDPGDSAVPLPVEPEQPPKHEEGDDLDQQIR